MAVTALSHVYPIGSRVNEAGRLEVGGCDVVELADRYGTPAYVVAEDDLRARAGAFRDALRERHGDDGEVLFASKALPCTAAYALFAEAGLGCDVASGGELALALRAGFPAERVYLHGNAKSHEEIREAVEAGVGTIVVDSFDDLDRLEEAVPAGGSQRVLVRVRPGVKPSTHDFISTGQVDSKFGLALDDARAAIDRLRGSDRLQLLGLHMHIGSQIFELASFRKAIEAIAGLGDFPVYNLGGGLGVAYTAQDEPPSIEAYVDAKVSAAHEILGTGKRIVIEPGRALVANAGVTLYRVMTVKRDVSTYVAVDGGMSDNLRPMLYGAVYEAALADRLAPGGELVNVAGKHCESSDVIVRDVHLHDPRPGDVLVTPVTGAYGHAMASNYNGVPRPPVLFCREGQARVVVRRETYEDLAARDVV
ncbi:MAG: diaminopimelate decarboxylase [Solirubrobacteraceae bacterium]|jgi:diaminopimelate decarboxylase|nr:diaminopimelate decarboxylase [Solirubrobacteraceae bacterium]